MHNALGQAGETMKNQSDDELLASLAAYLKQFSEGHEPVVPLFWDDSGSIDREKTLALPCYSEFKL
jgi:hypothetical protein